MMNNKQAQRRAFNMNQLMNNTKRMMSSKEIEEYTGKRHADIMRDIRNLINQEAILESSFAFESYSVPTGNGGTRQATMYLLDFDDPDHRLQCKPSSRRGQAMA